MALDGGIYDPAADEWTAIPPAPVAGPVIGSEANAMLLAGDRLAVVTRPVTSAGSTLSAAVYDVAEQRWHAAPAQHDITFTYDGVAWDGETLALVRVDRADADAGSAVDEPVTLRWRIGDTAWSHGAPAPLGVRFGAGTAFDGARLVVWGGTTSGRDAPPGPDAGATADGAIYDLASDTWEALPAAPLTPRIHPVVLWSNGRLVVCCGVDRLQGGVTELTDVATYDPQAGTWATLPSSPGTGAFPTDSQGFAAGDPPFLLVGQDVGPVFGDGRTYFLRGDRWERVSLNDLHRVGDVVVATTTSPGSLPGDHLFGVQVRTGRGRWIDAAKAPFTNRIEAAVVATGNDLVVVGGYQGDDVQATVGAWVLDLSTH
jgi:hypothetical protein